MATAAHPTHRAAPSPTWIAFALLVIGGLNWALVGLFNFDLVAAIFGDMSSVSRVIYTIVGISAVYCAVALPSWRKRNDVAA